MGKTVKDKKKDMVDFDFVVGNQYQVSNGVGSVSLTFLGMRGHGVRRVLVFDNPNQLGYPFLFIGAVVEILYPPSSSQTITITARLRARYGGNAASALNALDTSNTSWSTLP